MTQHRYTTLALTSLALSSAVSATAAEEMDEVSMLTTPDSTFSAGLGYGSEDQTTLGRYNGQREDQLYPLLDFNINRRDDETGTWTRVSGRNLGLSTRDVRWEQNRQGDWKYFIEYNQLESFSPYQFQTDLTGIGSAQQDPTGSERRLHFSQERRNVKLGLGKHFNKELSVSFSFREENKEGNRPWGADRETFIVEPIDYRTRELEAKVDYTAEALQLRGGYLLSVFDNPFQSVSITNLDSRDLETATPPDNRSHTLYLSGGYNLSQATRATFQVSKILDLQDEGFFLSNSESPTRTSLDGKIDTTRVDLGLVSRVMPQLTLKAKLRYDDRDDETPQSVFIATDRLNQLTSRTTSTGLLDATYRLDSGISLSAGLDHEQWKRIVTDEPNMAKRKRTDETTLRLGARKALSETLNGSVRLSHSERGGSAFEPGAADPDIFVNPIQWADRERDKLRLMLDWYPTEALSLQLVTEGSKDKYEGADLGPRDGSSALVSLDAGYQLSDEWRLNSWVSANRVTLDQSTQQTNRRDPDEFIAWGVEGKDQGYAFGLGIKGEPTFETKIGLDLQLARDESRNPLSVLEIGPNGSPVALADFPSALPEIEYRRLRLSFYGEYTLDEQQALRLDYRYDRIKTNDWTWNLYEGYESTTATSVSQPERESNHFIGLTYQYRYW